MKKIVATLLILSILSLTPLAFCACKKNTGAEAYDPAKFTEGLDLSNYQLVFCDDFNGELDRSVWGDTRQGTRRDGYWTKNLAFTDGEGNLVLRTEVSGSRYCSETVDREVEGHSGSRVIVTYDDCNPFGMMRGDFGDINALPVHTDALVGYVILEKFEELSAKFTSFENCLLFPFGSNETIAAGSEKHATYTPFYDAAMELYTYYSFVKATKSVRTTIEKSALIDITGDRAFAFGGSADPAAIDFRAAIARLFGFSSEVEFASLAADIAHFYCEYYSHSPYAFITSEALENGCFHTENGRTIFPIAFQNDSGVILTYLILDADMRVSVWVNDMTAVLRAVNYNHNYYSAATVRNQTYCKNTLFVTGPEGVYSGALRTKDTYTHGYGYYEIRCKLPDVEGIWHAFWMMCGDVYSEENGSTDGVEIDVFEYLPARDAVNCALHWDGYDEAHQNAHKRYENTSLADGNYHTFGALWDENGYAFYIDGKKVWNTTGGGVCPLDGYMKISTEYGEWGDWVGTLDLGDLPVDWVIDYVKIYDKK